MRITTIIGLIAVISCIAVSLSFPFSQEDTNKIMPFINDKSYCIKCHNSEEDQDFIIKPAYSCNTYCLTCHKEINNKNHHIVGVKILEKEIDTFNYSRLGNMTCYTCHDLHNSRFDSQAWKSQSLFDKTFKKKKIYKTYYLVIRNDRGQLCKSCH